MRSLCWWHVFERGAPMPEHREWRDGYDSPQARPDQRVSYESRRERARRERLRHR